MKKLFALFALTVILAGTALAAAPWIYTAQQSTNAADKQLKDWGMTNDTDRAMIVYSNFEAELTFGLALRDKVWALACRLAQDGSITVTDKVQLGRAIMTADPAPVGSVLISWLQSIPLKERARFAQMASNAVPSTYPLTPVGGMLGVKYGILQGINWSNPAGATEQELVNYLLAPEPMKATDVIPCKRAIKDKATALARIQLRAMPNPPPASSNGISSVSIMITPVVDALNAPLCVGLEPALRGLGGVSTNVDRSQLTGLCATWTNAAMQSLAVPSEVSAQLGKISVVMGPDAFTAWAAVYNRGN